MAQQQNGGEPVMRRYVNVSLRSTIRTILAEPPISAL
jgi:hypothetical protein